MSNLAPAPSASPVTKASANGRAGLRAIALVAGGAILVGGIGLGLAWRHGWLEKDGRGAGLPRDGSTAPGVEELRALGCDQATVLDADDLAPLVGKANAPRVEKIIVTCVGRGASVPTCDEAATAYAHAPVDARGGFLVTVRKSDGRWDRCMGRYAEDGTPAL